WRRRWTGQRPRALFEDVGHPFDRSSSTADLHERADDVADHVPEKTIADDLVRDELARVASKAERSFVAPTAACPDDARREHLAHGRRSRAAGRLKGREVATSLHQSSGRGHPIDVQRLSELPDEPAFERTENLAEPEAISVMFPRRVKARVKRL